MKNTILYHGSPVSFNKFDYKKIGTANGLNASYGFYFSNMIDGALRYGDYIYEVEFPNGKELSNFNRTLTNTKINEILKTIYKNSEYNHYQHYDENLNPNNIKRLNFISDMFDKNLVDTEIVGNLINSGADVETTLKALHANGYTHTTDLLEHGITSSLETHYILYYEPKIIKKYKTKK